MYNFAHLYSSKPPPGRKVITPDQINSLFSNNKQQNNNMNVNNNNEEGNNGFFNFNKPFESNQNNNNNNNVPEWILEAERQRGMKKSSGKKEKALTDDWRFWAAMITGAGFATAFFQIYQQTGAGTLLEQQELII